MSFSLKGFFYHLLIDPLLSGLRGKLASLVMPEETVIEVACGTGALSLVLANKTQHVTAIDLSEVMIRIARRMVRKKKIENIAVEVMDATDLSCYPDKHFDVSVISMALHQFSHETALKILSEMERIAGRVIMGDYNCHMNPGLPARLSWIIECAAGGDHYRNFRKFMITGGINSLAADAELAVKETDVTGSSVFITLSCLPAP
jgi:SAM-dependent methyltransferase